MPTTVQVLDGAGNTAPVRVNVVPGSIWRSSGGGFAVMQLLVSDVTGKPFVQYMSEAVLGPVGMILSTYEQPHPPARAAPDSSDGTAPTGPRVRKVACLSRDGVTGLWTTPTDLARFAMEVQQSLAGKSNKVIFHRRWRSKLTAR